MSRSDILFIKRYMYNKKIANVFSLKQHDFSVKFNFTIEIVCCIDNVLC